MPVHAALSTLIVVGSVGSAFSTLCYLLNKSWRWLNDSGNKEAIDRELDQYEDMAHCIVAGEQYDAMQLNDFTTKTASLSKHWRFSKSQQERVRHIQAVVAHKLAATHAQQRRAHQIQTWHFDDHDQWRFESRAKCRSSAQRLHATRERLAKCASVEESQQLQRAMAVSVKERQGPMQKRTDESQLQRLVQLLQGMELHFPLNAIHTAMCYFHTDAHIINHLMTQQEQQEAATLASSCSNSMADGGGHRKAPQLTKF